MLDAREIPVHRGTEMTDANSSNGNRVNGLDTVHGGQFSSQREHSLAKSNAFFLDQVNYIQNV